MSGLNWLSTDKQMLSISGVRLEVQTWGPPPQEAPTLVLLHEGLGSVAMWRDFPEKMSVATGLGVFAYSRQGYGNSDPCNLPRPLDYMEREASQVLPSLLEAASIQESVLLGHSDGASIAALHQSNPGADQVRGLVLMAPHFFVEDISVESIRNVRTAWRETDLSDRLGKYHASPENAFRGWNDAWLDAGFRDWNITDCIDAISVPCMAIQGRLDEYGTAAQVEVLSKHSRAEVEIHLLDDCGHSPHKDQPDQTIALISAFTKRILKRQQVPAQ